MLKKSPSDSQWTETITVAFEFSHPSIKSTEIICSQATVKINSYQKCYSLKKTNKVLDRRVLCTPSKHLKNKKAFHTGDSSELELFPECPIILITIIWALEITVKSFELPLNWELESFLHFWFCWPEKEEMRNCDNCQLLHWSSRVLTAPPLSQEWGTSLRPANNNDVKR